MSLSNICLKPVGFVQTNATGKEVNDKPVISKIVFNEEYAEALMGIEDFSHLNVLFWLHEISEQDRKQLKARPCGRDDMPLLGLFATCTPRRPNPIGLTRVKLLDVTGNVVTVQGLDAFNGTPVLDIKPFDHWNKTADYKIPDWWKKIIKERKKKKNV
ncbi:MAG: tRNA (N6-threonylcarbamoyladenosine(37)-N6)-methyltransferase TrmO [Candidatus Bathyarchaeota archaeon]|nr:MAG: tRNA (N6-threonylcarbamoyladenosine(37)-N6)-methyltransferase TrmO [Candidatus Bathyarchaeota archaeon]